LQKTFASAARVCFTGQGTVNKSFLAGVISKDAAPADPDYAARGIIG
jgi:hypothetical protein